MERFLSLEEVMHITSMSESGIARQVKSGAFPASVPIGERRVAWLLSEIKYWIELTNNREQFQIVVSSNVAVNDDGCWEWMRGGDSSGYAQVAPPGKKKKVYAHRLAYEAFRKFIPRTMQVDHLCRNSKCVNPWHLEPVTCGENVKRTVPYVAGSKESACYFGHEFTEENTIQRPYGQRFCKTCMTELSTKKGDE